MKKKKKYSVSAKKNKDREELKGNFRTENYENWSLKEKKDQWMCLFEGWRGQRRESLNRNIGQ